MKSEDQNRVNGKLETKRIFKRYGAIAEKTTQENNITEGHLHEWWIRAFLFLHKSLDSGHYMLLEMIIEREWENLKVEK